MTATEVGQILRLVCGYWPNPQMTDDEIRVWTMKLGPCDFELAARIIEGFAGSGKDFRPNAGQFVLEYQARRPRFSGAIEIIDRPELPATTENRTPEEWREHIRKQLAEAKGPALSPLAKPGSNHSLTQNRYATDSPQSRALARAKVEEFAAQQKGGGK